MNLDSNIDFDLKRFFRWWGRELSFLLPEKVRQWLSDQSEYVFLTVDQEKLSFSRMENGKNKPIGELALSEETDELYAQLKKDHVELEKARCVLRLTGEQAIGKLLYLPAAAKENLDQVVGFEMDKYTPFKSEQVYSAIKPLGKEENGQIKVLLALTPKIKLDHLLQSLKNIGIYPVAVDYEGAANDFEEDFEPYNLLPEEQRPSTDKMMQLLNGSMALIVLLLTIAAFVYPVWHEEQIVTALKQQIEELENDTRIVQSRQMEIDEIIDETSRLIKTKNSTPPLTELINALSKLIGDDTWLTHLQYSNDRLQIQGQSPTASALIGILEASPLFSNVRFVSPLTQDKRTGQERFQISLQVNASEEKDADVE